MLFYYYYFFVLHKKDSPVWNKREQIRIFFFNVLDYPFNSPQHKQTPNYSFSLNYYTYMYSI